MYSILIDFLYAPNVIVKTSKKMRLEEETSKYQEILRDYFDSSPEFREYLGLVRKYSSGKIFVVGGRLVRVLANRLYGSNLSLGDVDFLTEEASEESLSENSWEIHVTKFGDIQFKRDREKIDLMRLKNVHSLIRKKLPPNLVGFLKCVPLNVQSIAYDTDTGELFGNAGIYSVKKEFVKVNDYSEAALEANRRGCSVEEFVAGKAKELKFDYY